MAKEDSMICGSKRVLKKKIKKAALYLVPTPIGNLRRYEFPSY